jgi:cobalamin-dependent methionine synthase I
LSKEFISIGESIHASIPRHAKAMKTLADKGLDAYSTPSEDLDHVINLIKTQVADGATYVAVNIDALGEDDPQIAVEHMAEYVKLVRIHGSGIPVCIDSSDDNVLIAGLKAWYDTDESVKKPLINSIKVYSMGNMFPLKKDYDYAFIGLLMSEQGGVHTADELYAIAKEIFNEAVNKYGFAADDIIYDSTVFPLAIDMPMMPGQASYTHNMFQTMKKIKDDPEMQGVHFSGGITNSARDLPARKIGVMRAFVHKAMEYGLDAGIVNPKHDLSGGTADPELLKLVDAFGQMDGSMDKMNDAMMLMADFCKNCR